MTEEEWLACADPVPMLEFLRGPGSTLTTVMAGREVPVTHHRQMRISDRKARLFACACCRRLWHLLDEEHCRRLLEIDGWLHSLEGRERDEPPLTSCRQTVELAERSADQAVSSDALHTLSEATLTFRFIVSDYCACYDDSWGPFDSELVASGLAAYAVHCATQYYPLAADVFGRATGAFDCLAGVVWEATQAVAYLRSTDYGQAAEGGDPEERASLGALLREIVGNPFRFRSVDPSWLTWNSHTIPKLAQLLYDERHLPQGILDADRLGVLADALEESGCTDAEILDHCRGVGPHVRGCWVVDSILGKS